MLHTRAIKYKIKVILDKETKIKNELKDNIKKKKMEMKMIPDENTVTQRTQ